MVVGSGIFTLTGTAAAGLKFDYPSIFKAPLLNLLMSGKDAVGTFGRPGAGPAISISFLLVALACSFAALCYAELASMIPVSGSAYTYAYATLGEIFAWIIGWDLILEYAVGNMAVAVGFGAYFNDLLDNVFGFHLPSQLTQPIFIEGKPTGAWFNLPSFLLVMLLTLAAGAGCTGIRAREYHHRHRQGGSHPAVYLRRRPQRRHSQLASVHAQRLFRSAHRSRHRFF